MNILLVRHGETPWNREGRYQGRTDIPLSSEGERQVRALGERLAGIQIDVAIASPLSRARRTAEAILAHHTAPLELDDGLLEISHGKWEGQLASDLERDHAEMLGQWRDAPGRDVPAGPEAETLGDVERRAWPVLARLVERTNLALALGGERDIGPTLIAPLAVPRSLAVADQQAVHARTLL
jgi:broad specificity phosphatase PhoE